MDDLSVGSATASPAREREIRKLSRQLEAVFVRQMFEEMAKTVSSSELFPETPGRDLYDQWFRSEIADRFAEGGGTGLGDTIASQLLRSDGLTAADRLAARSVFSGDARVFDGPVRDLHSGFSPRVPAAPITSGFGHRLHPVTGQPDLHRGIDLAVPVGSSVRSPFAGTVTKVGENQRLGRFVWVEHQNGFRSVFGHLHDTSRSPGEWVGVGETVARSGNSGTTTGPHLHYGLYRGETPVDPEAYLGRYLGGASHVLLGTSGHRPKK
ncbi:MAG: peptidoglycan DD-metalloendopeptidase family protein [Myxococcota bacterium]